MNITLNSYFVADNFLAFEFKTEKLVEVPEAGESDLFRLEMRPGQSKNSSAILVASDEDYSVYDEVTNLFDLQGIVAQICVQYMEKDIPNVTKDYKKFLEEQAEHEAC